MLQFAGCAVRLAGVRVTPIGVGAPFHSHLRSSKQVVTASWSRPQLHLEYAVVLMSTQHRDNSVVVDDNNTKSGGPYVFVQTCNSSLDPKTLYLVGSWRSFFSIWCCGLRWMQTSIKARRLFLRKPDMTLTNDHHSGKRRHIQTCARPWTHNSALQISVTVPG